MKYSLTDKLAFDSDPVITIKETELTVDSNAETVLKVMDILEEEGEITAIRKCVPLLFNKRDREKIKELGLKMKDYQTLIITAISLAMGENPDEESEGEH